VELAGTWGELGGFAIPEGKSDDRRAREAELVRRAQGGDLAAFEQLYRDNAGRVFAVCLRVCADRALAEELVQDVFVRAWQKLGSFRGESALSTWLHPLAINVALSERRSRKRRESRVTTTDDLTPFERPEAPERAVAPTAAVDLEKAISGLPPGARAVFVLHDVEGYKHEEIAELMGVASGTSKAQLHRARRLLREALQ
jgi:RNA polymerase sigma-70 factor (ECF subfamily)